MSASLEEQARAALTALRTAPPAVFIPSGERLARWNAAISLLAQAVAILGELAVSGDPDALEADGHLGDSALVIQAEEAASDLRSDLGELAAFDARRWAAGAWGDMASGEYSGEKGQRQLVAIAAAVAERFPPLPPLGERS